MTRLPIDNTGPAILEYFRAGLPLPEGVFVVRDTIDFGTGCGGALIGAGGHDQARNHNAWKGQKATVLVWDGPIGQPMLRIRRSKFRLKNIGLVGCVVKDYLTDKGHGPLIEVTQQGAQWPVGNITLDCTLTNSEQGVYFAPGSHGDHIKAELLTHQVVLPYIVNENQSVDHRVHIMAKGDGDTILDVRDGGKIDATVRTNGKWNTLLSVGDAAQKTFPTKNNGDYSIDLRMDNGDSFERLYMERYKYEWGRATVSITGSKAAEATIKNDPLLLNKSQVRINLRNPYTPYVWESK